MTLSKKLDVDDSNMTLNKAKRWFGSYEYDVRFISMMLRVSMVLFQRCYNLPSHAVSIRRITVRSILRPADIC